MITSAQNSKVKLVRGLLSAKKYRDENGLFVVEGVRLAEEAVKSSAQIEFAFFSNQLSARGRELLPLMEKAKVEVEELDADLMNRVSDTKNAQGILLAMLPAQPSLGETLDLVLVLDQIRDPGNLGTLLRSAAALGVQAVLLTPGSTDAWSPKVLRAGMGAHFKLEIAARTPIEIRDLCKNSSINTMDILLADSDKGSTCWEEDLTRPLCLVVGGEAAGAAGDLREIIDASIRIPMQSNTESYNAAVAGSILLYETYRQRNSQ